MPLGTPPIPIRSRKTYAAIRSPEAWASEAHGWSRWAVLTVIVTAAAAILVAAFFLR